MKRAEADASALFLRVDVGIDPYKFYPTSV